MKNKILFFSLLTLLIMFVSCSDFEQPNEETTDFDETNEETAEIQSFYKLPENSLEEIMKDMEPLTDKSYAETPLAVLENDELNIMVSKKVCLP